MQQMSIFSKCALVRSIYTNMHGVLHCLNVKTFSHLYGEKQQCGANRWALFWLLLWWRVTKTILHPLCCCWISWAVTAHRVSIFPVYTSKLHFVATLTLDPLLYNLHHAGGKKTKPKHENSQVKGNAAKKENFKWRTLGLYRLWHERAFPWRRRTRLRWRRRRRLGSGQRRRPCADPWHCSTAPEGTSAGGRLPGASAGCSRCHRCGGSVAHPSPECRVKKRKHTRRIRNCVLLSSQIFIPSAFFLAYTTASSLFLLCKRAKQDFFEIFALFKNKKLHTKCKAR